MKKYRWVIAILSLLLVISLGGCIYLYLEHSSQSYLSSEKQIYIMESGILYANLQFGEGTEREITYDFDHSAYQTLIEEYKIDQIAGEGSEFERVLRLMNEFAPRLTHESNFTADVKWEALPLLKYSLDNKKHGLNCRCKSQILNEMCLALGIYARKAWICPNSVYDDECHVVNEIYDTEYKKWIMFDITNNEYWVDESGTPLSILEIREHGANQKFCTPVVGNELSRKRDLKKLKEKHMDDFIYIMKNMAFMKYFTEYSVGEPEISYALVPKSYGNSDYMISESSITKAPDIELQVQ